jgi:hypothetical protein
VFSRSRVTYLNYCRKISIFIHCDLQLTTILKIPRNANTNRAHSAIDHPIPHPLNPRTADTKPHIHGQFAARKSRKPQQSPALSKPTNDETPSSSPAPATTAPTTTPTASNEPPRRAAVTATGQHALQLHHKANF